MPSQCDTLNCTLTINRSQTLTSNFTIIENYPACARSPVQCTRLHNHYVIREWTNVEMTKLSKTDKLRNEALFLVHFHISAEHHWPCTSSSHVTTYEVVFRLKFLRVGFLPYFVIALYEGCFGISVEKYSGTSLQISEIQILWSLIYWFLKIHRRVRHQVTRKPVI